MSRIPNQVAALVVARSKGLCEAATPCCLGSGEHLHHRKLRSRGGGHTAANLLHLCHPCHGWVHANPAAATVNGWMVPSWAVPEDVLVLRWAWWLRLADTGQWSLEKEAQ